MEDYSGLISKLKLDLYSTQDFFPVQMRSECAEITQKLDDFIGKNLFDFVKISQTIQNIISMYKSILIGDTSDEELEEQRKIPDSKIHFYTDMKRFCEQLIVLYNLLNSISLLEYFIDYLKENNKKETANYLEDIVSDLDKWILNVGTDARKLYSVFERLDVISDEFVIYRDNKHYMAILNTITSIYSCLKILYSRV